MDPTTRERALRFWAQRLACPVEGLTEPAALRDLVPASATAVGPAFVGYSVAFPEPAPELARLPSARAPELRSLEAALSPLEWRHANLEAAAPPIFALLHSGRALAASGGETLLGQVSHLGVATHPSHRGGGLARRVVSAAGSAAVAAGLLPQYQTLYANRAALQVGRAVGFEPFATTLSVRWGSAAG